MDPTMVCLIQRDRPLENPNIEIPSFTPQGRKIGFHEVNAGDAQFEKE